MFRTMALMVILFALAFAPCWASNQQVSGLIQGIPPIQKIYLTSISQERGSPIRQAISAEVSPTGSFTVTLGFGEYLIAGYHPPCSIITNVELPENIRLRSREEPAKALGGSFNFSQISALPSLAGALSTNGFSRLTGFTTFTGMLSGPTSPSYTAAVSGFSSIGLSSQSFDRFLRDWIRSSPTGFSSLSNPSLGTSNIGSLFGGFGSNSFSNINSSLLRSSGTGSLGGFGTLGSSGSLGGIGTGSLGASGRPIGGSIGKLSGGVLFSGGFQCPTESLP